MKHSQKGPGPASFDEWLELENEDWKPSYAQLSGRALKDVRASLLREQEHLCGYCGRELGDDFTDSHIDHFRPQARFNGISDADLTLDYANFVLSCGPPSRNRLPSTCGDAKGSRFPEAHIEPWDPGCEGRFVFGGIGTIVPADPNDEAASRMIDLLKLNHPSLQSLRRTYFEGLERDIRRDGIDRNTYQDEVIRQRTAVDGRRQAFSHAGARYLEVEFG